MEIFETILKLIGIGIAIVVGATVALTVLSFWGIMVLLAVIADIFGSMNQLYPSPIETTEPNDENTWITEINIDIDGTIQPATIWYSVHKPSKIAYATAVYVNDTDVYDDLSDTARINVARRLQEFHHVY